MELEEGWSEEEGAEAEAFALAAARPAAEYLEANKARPEPRRPRQPPIEAPPAV
jgi:hypothetical protein